MKQRIYRDVIFCLPGREFSQEYIASWTNTVAYLERNGISYDWVFNYNPIITETRNALLGHDFLTGTSTNSSYILNTLFADNLVCQKVIMIDDDIVWSVADIEKLIYSPYDATIGIYVLTDNNHCAVAKDSHANLMTKDEVLAHDKPFEVLGGGLGFTCVNFNWLQKMPMPWFEIVTRPTENGTVVYGEDFDFFTKLRNLGAKIYADPSVKVGHVKQKVLGF